jgi:DNA recombination protein RmuC
MSVQVSYLIAAIFGLVVTGLVVWLVIILRRKSALERELAMGKSDHALCRQQCEALSLSVTDHQAMVAHRDDQIRQLQDDVGALRVARATLEAQVVEKSGQLDKSDALNTRNAEQTVELQREASQLRARIAELATLLDDERKQSAEKIALLNEAREQLKSEFQNLAQRIFEDKGQKFAEQNRMTMDHLITPLRDQIGDFKKRVEDVYDKESRDRASLQTEIHHLKELNQRISKEAMNLTRALKGDSKARGNWGEVVLERVLEASGLQKGREYETQVHLKDGKGKRYQPDVIVRLPQGKDVVVDAKVSLNDYEVYYSAEDADQKETALKAHIESIRTHIRSLAGKSYEDLEGVRSLDFVLMFVPIEAAFLAAVEKDRGLFAEAFDQNIMVVSPSTLLVTLRTIENIWRHEYQNRYAIEIAKKAGGLYNKFVGFVEALEQVGQQLDRAKDAYQTASDRLVNGKGNLIRRTQELKALGVKAGKELPKHLLEIAEPGEADADE